MLRIQHRRLCILDNRPSIAVAKRGVGKLDQRRGGAARSVRAFLPQLCPPHIEISFWNGRQICFSAIRKQLYHKNRRR